MDRTEFLEDILKQKAVSLATVDEEGNPSNRIIDMMYREADCLYFLTAKGKSLYRELKQNPIVAISFCQGEVSYTLKGKAVPVPDRYLEKLFERNPFMKDLYPEGTRDALVVFRIEDWHGEFFDLTTRPITRQSFFQNGAGVEKGTYHIDTEKCLSCGLCLKTCPSRCIDIEKKRIDSSHCLRCGLCLKSCPHHAVFVQK